MNRSLLVLALLTGVTAPLLFVTAQGEAMKTPGTYPQVQIGTGSLKLTVYLPDAEKGYYRGPRFDWSGMIAAAEFEGHRVFGEWRTPHDPRCHDHGLGPAEEFGIGTALGFVGTKPGERFIKIGVGHLERDAGNQYLFYSQYKIAKAAPWQVTNGPDWVAFQQDLQDDRGWGYRYVKRVELTKNVGGFRITHELTNTGREAIATTWYCHNFLMIDGRPTGSGYQVTWPFALKLPAPTLADWAAKGVKVQDRQVTFTQPVTGAVHAQLPDVAGPLFRGLTVTHPAAGAGIELSLDAKVSRCDLFAVDTVVCPEPYLELNLKAGESARWTSDYRVFTVPPRK